MTGLLPLGTAERVKRNLTPPPERELPSDPVAWVRDELGEHLWSKQRQIIRSVQENRRTAVPAGVGVGKTMTAGRAGANWIAAHPLGTAKVVTSAPSTRQIKGLLWPEIARAHAKGAMPGTIRIPKGDAGMAQWFIGGEEVAIGFKPQDLTDPDQARTTFSGYHAEHLLVILDEANGLPRWLWEGAFSMMTNETARILAIGNPDSPATMFEEVCRPGSGWEVIPIAVEDSPNFTGEQVPEQVRAVLPSKAWLAEAEAMYGGADNPLFQSRVKARFPDTSPTKVVSPKMIREAWDRELPGRERGAFGVDVARSPRGDHSAMYRIRGGVARLVDTWRGLPLTGKEHEDTATARVYRHASSTPGVPVVVDTDGLGVGLADGLRTMENPSLHVVAFSAAGPAHRPHRYDSRRSELWWEYRLAMERGEVDLDPQDEMLAAQLQQPKWWPDSRGRIHVETKKEMAKRGLASPDRADSVILGDAGAPLDLSETGELGMRTQPPQRRRRPEDAARSRFGEGQALRSRKW